MTPAVKEIRVLARGVRVLETLCRLGACSLADLHRETALPKSTLRRILFTFEQANFLRCSLGDGLYRANIQVPAFFSPADVSPFIGRLVAAAQPVLTELSARASWPTDLVVRDGLQLRIVETNRALSPFPVNQLELGDNIDMLSSAVGRAYLAFCPPAERAEIIGRLRQLHNAPELAALPRILRETRERGYAMRGPNCMGGTQRQPTLIDKLHAIAVPVLLDERVLCCFNLLWRPSAVSNAGQKSRMARILRQCAAQIADNYRTGYGSTLEPQDLRAGPGDLDTAITGNSA